ncbi:hypothetical protein ACH4T9_12980 [Micromonospora sp. NPDC020750]|uniref:hypothetical protein n=1 Tax=unclassified Micromonospora TaxID=2617518 RepID=UPI00379CB234
MDPNTTDQFTAELSEFAALLRARIAVADDDTNPPGSSPAELAWHAVYGSIPIDSTDPTEVASEAGKILYRKLMVACLFAGRLASELAGQTGRTALDVVDELELRLVKAGTDPDCPVCEDFPGAGHYCAACGRQG